MEFRKIVLTDLLDEIDQIPVDWRDDVAHELIQGAGRIVKRLKRSQNHIQKNDLKDLFLNEPMFLDICRLFLEMSQDAFVNEISAQLGQDRVSWPRLKALGRSEPELTASALVEMGLPDVIVRHFRKRWTVADVLIERYKMSRGRAVQTWKNLSRIEGHSCQMRLCHS